MDAEQYVSILEDKLLPRMENSGLFKKSIIFQQDNNPKYSSKRAQNWFKFQGIRLFDRPAQSLDLSPVEHLWKYSKKDPMDIEDQQKEFKIFGRESRQSRGRQRLRSVRS